MIEVLSKKDYDKVEKLIEYIEKEGEITPKEAENICDKSSATVRRYLKMLVETGYIEAQGSTNNLVYKMCVAKLGYSNYIIFLCKLVNLIANKIKK